jgi:medium-chain acyl-[acyl-carrier-protein] hydrolase
MSSSENPDQTSTGQNTQDNPGSQRVPRWYKRITPLSATARLFCFPYAGGNARMFREWHDWCGPEIEVIALELPGRGLHSRAPLINSMSTMIDRLLPVLDPLLDKPFALFGHSMGALISFELSRALEVSGRKVPQHLFVSGMRPPHLWGGHKIHTLPDREFVEALRSLNGTPSEILADNDLLEMFLPRLRADLCLSETYHYEPAPPLSHSITVFSGLNDKTAPVEYLSEWQHHTQNNCTLRLFEGDHFFIQQHAHLVAASILKSLGRVFWPAAFESPAAQIAVRQPQEAEPVFSGAD